MRWIIRGLVLLLLLAAVFVISVLMLPRERITRIAAEQISKLTGRQVTMQGDTRISLYPVLGVSTGQVVVANAEWSDGAPMFQAKTLKIGVEPQVLWGGDIRITGLEATDPVINLERAADGRVNWQLGVENVAPSGQTVPGEAPAQSSRLALTLDRALIRNATFRYTDHGTGQHVEMQGMDFDLRWPDWQGRATFDATLRPAGTPVRVTGYLDRVGDFIDGAVTDASITVKTRGGSAKFIGQASADAQAKGRLTAEIDRTAAFLAALGMSAVEPPPGLGRSVNADTLLTLDQNRRLSLRKTVLQLDGNRLSGAADIELGGAKPVIAAQIDAGALDLSRLGADSAAGADTGSGTAGRAAQGWSTDPIDASALALADGRMALTADSIDLGDLKIGKARTMLSLDNARLVFDLREIRAYQALITGQFVINNRAGLSVGGNLKAAGLDLESFLTDAAGITRLSASADASLDFLGVGQSQQAIMSSLSGKGALKAGHGVISGIDLDRVMRSGVSTGGTTVFDEMQASFTIDKGRLQNDDLLLQLPRARAEGKGVIDLGARSIDYLFTPVLLEGETSKGLAIPVRIRGPWDNPRILPDLEKAIDLNLADERRALKDKAEDEVRRAVEKELGVQVEEGQSVEDALKEKLRKEAEKGLLKLFQ